MYLLIQNPGVAPVEGYTHLGVSTTRNAGVSGTIGTFGSGSKMGVNLALRNGISPVVFCSKLRLEFHTEPLPVDDGLRQEEFGAVYCKMSGRLPDGKTRNTDKDLGFVVEYGIHDWTNIAMGLREFVCNAIDRTIREEGDFREALKAGRLVVKTVEDQQVRAKDGYTRVFIPLIPDVQRFYGELPVRFLHFSSPELIAQTVLKKNGRKLDDSVGPMIYREGVLVKQLDTNGVPALFDYNFNRSLEVDESRNVSDYAVRAYAARAVRDSEPDILRIVFRSLIETENFWEAHFDRSDLCPTWAEDERLEKWRTNWNEGWRQAAGEGIMVGSLAHEHELVAKKGFQPVQVKSTNWVSAADAMRLPSSSLQVISKWEKEGRELLPATPDAAKALDRVWELLRKHRYTFDKEPPKIGCFRDKMNAGQSLLGFQHGDTIYIEESQTNGGQNKMLLQTVLEEVVHYVTGSTDMSRDMQEFLIRLIIEMAFGEV